MPPLAALQIMLYHSPAVARNLLSNCDLHEAWLDFLVRKSQNPVPSLLGEPPLPCCVCCRALQLQQVFRAGVSWSTQMSTVSGLLELLS